MKRVTDALAVSRSNTYERSRSPRPRPERYSKAEDAFLLPLIVELLGGRQTWTIGVSSGCYIGNWLPVGAL